MSAKIMRSAAAVLRERAKAARDITGASDWFVECRGLHFTGEYGVRSSGGFVAGDTVEEEAEFIATMNPGVAAALADLLDAAAEGLARRGVTARISRAEADAASLARLILDGAS
jgi:hypothetical protein